MAIYKLRDAAHIIRGKGKFYKRHLQEYGDLNGLHYGLLYKADIIANWNTKISMDFWREDNIVGKSDILLIDVSESFDELGHFTYYDCNDVAMAGNHTLVIKANTNIVLPKYLFYRLQAEKRLLRKFATGDKVASISLNDFGSISIDFPTIAEQRRIIDIIEPIESLISIVDKYSKKLSQIQVIGKKNKISDYVTWSSQGYAYKKKEIGVGGKYNIFTIKNIINSNKFSKTDLIKNNALLPGDVITGMSGTIGTVGIITDRNIVSNQRTLALRTEYPLQIKLAIENNNKIILSKATGAVQKNISAKSILDLPFALDNTGNKSSSIAYVKLIEIKKIAEALLKDTINLLIK